MQRKGGTSYGGRVEEGMRVSLRNDLEVQWKLSRQSWSHFRAGVCDSIGQLCLAGTSSS